jgi:hypothetical protein
MTCGWKFHFENIEIDNSRSYDGNGKLRFPLLNKELKFPWPIGELVEFKNVYIVMLDNVSLRAHLERWGEKYDLYNENVFGISKITGEMLWQIEPIAYRANQDCPYTGIVKEGDKVAAYSWDGYKYTLEPATGEILKEEFTK